MRRETHIVPRGGCFGVQREATGVDVQRALEFELPTALDVPRSTKGWVSPLRRTAYGSSSWMDVVSRPEPVKKDPDQLQAHGATTRSPRCLLVLSHSISNVPDLSARNE